MSIQASVGYPGKGMTMPTDVSASDQAQSIIIESVINHVVHQIDSVERFIINSEKNGADRAQLRGVADYTLDHVSIFIAESFLAYPSSLGRVESVLMSVRGFINQASLYFYDENFLSILRDCRSEIKALLGAAV